MPTRNMAPTGKGIGFEVAHVDTLIPAMTELFAFAKPA